MSSRSFKNITYKLFTYKSHVCTIIIIIILRCLYGFLWLSRGIRPYHLSFPVGFQDYRAAVYKLLLVDQQLHVRVKEFQWRALLISSLLMSSSLLLQQFSACLVRLIWMVLRWKVGVRTAAFLWDVASRICSVQLIAFLCNSCLAFSLYT